MMKTLRGGTKRPLCCSYELVLDDSRFVFILFSPVVVVWVHVPPSPEFLSRNFVVSFILRKENRPVRAVLVFNIYFLHHGDVDKHDFTGAQKISKKMTGGSRHDIVFGAD